MEEKTLSRSLIALAALGALALLGMVALTLTGHDASTTQETLSDVLLAVVAATAGILTARK